MRLSRIEAVAFARGRRLTRHDIVPRNRVQSFSQAMKPFYHFGVLGVSIASLSSASTSPRVFPPSPD